MKKTSGIAFNLVKLMRPKQWIKNLFVLAPLIFSGQFIHPESVIRTLSALLIFCLASSAAYIINDFTDIKEDQKHPIKSKTRPLAAGLITKNQALGLVSLLYGVLIIAALKQPHVLMIICIYLGINLAYSLRLKHLPVIDIFTIASGFVLRIYAGAMALVVPVSSWMFITTLCLALYLAIIKRKQELRQNGAKSRKVLAFYTDKLLDRYADISSTGTLLFYSLFVMTARPELVLTIPVVLFALFRYWFLIEIKKLGESPTELLYSDIQLVLALILWVSLSLWYLWPSIS